MPDRTGELGVWPALGRFMAAVTIACCSMDVLAAIDGWSYYLGPLEMFEAFSWSLTYYAAIFTVIGAAILLVTTAALKLVRANTSIWTPLVMSWLGQTIVALSALRLMHFWGAAIHLMPTAPASRPAKLALAAAVASGIGYRTLFKRRPDPEILRFIRGFALPLGIAAASALAYSLVAAVSPSSPNMDAAPASARPNVILITIDTLSARHMSLYGYSRKTTPRLEEWAARMSVFDRFYANCNFTTCAMQSLMTGTLPWTHRALQLPAQINPAIASRGLLPTLKYEGYRTLAATTSFWASPSNLSVQQYADIQRDAMPDYYIQPPIAILERAHAVKAVLLLPPIQYALYWIEYAGIKLKLIAASGAYDPRRVFAVARELTQDGFAKFSLLWVHSLGPHAPYAAAPSFLRLFDSSTFALTRQDSSPLFDFEARSDPDFPQRYIGRYDEGVAANDAAISDFLDFLVKQGLYEDALIVITADHGESFGHGYGQHAGPALYEDLIRIPLLIKLPGQHTGQRILTLTQQVDLLATLRDVLGLPVDSFDEGRSLLPVMRGEAGQKPVFSMNFEQNRPTGPLANGTVAMIDWPWKYVHYFGSHMYPQMAVLEDALYDLEQDPEELSNQIQAQPGRSKQMREQIEKQLALHGSALR